MTNNPSNRIQIDIMIDTGRNETLPDLMGSLDRDAGSFACFLNIG